VPTSSVGVCRRYPYLDPDSDYHSALTSVVIINLDIGWSIGDGLCHLAILEGVLWVISLFIQLLLDHQTSTSWRVLRIKRLSFVSLALREGVSSRLEISVNATLKLKNLAAVEGATRLIWSQIPKGNFCLRSLTHLKKLSWCKSSLVPPSSLLNSDN